MTPVDTTSRLPIWRAAFVIARRDFRAVLFSKAFLFFLLGPIIFAGISLVAGAMGARAVENAAPPRLAVAMDLPANLAFETAHMRLSGAVPVPPIVLINEQDADPGALLADRSRNFGAVLSGTLAKPQLTGTAERINSWRGEVALIAADASGAGVRTLPEVSLSPTRTSAAKTRSTQTGTAKAAITLLFLLTMLLAGMVLSNLVEEKANKIIEILAAAIPMNAVFYGKLFAMLAVSFVGISVWGAIGLAVGYFGGASIGPLPEPAVGWPLFLALFLVYFAMAYLLIGSVFLTIGSMAPTVRDVQTLSMPATILQLGVFFLASYALSDIGSTVELLAVLFPISSPYSMLARAAQSGDLWPHALALAWQIGWVVIFVKTGAYLFRSKVMKSGKAMGFPFRRKAAS